MPAAVAVTRGAGGRTYGSKMEIAGVKVRGGEGETENREVRVSRFLEERVGT